MKLRIPNNSYENLKNSGTYGFQNFDHSSFLESWKEAERKWNTGDYHQSVRLRSEILTDIYNHHSVNERGYFPPVFSLEFTGAFGHLGLLGACLEAQSMGLIPPGRKTILAQENSREWHILDSFKSQANIVTYKSGAGWTEIPVNWHISERLQIVRGWDSFIDMYEVLEIVYSHRKVDKSAPLLELNSSFSDKAKTALEEVGLHKTDWFVTIHVRSAGHEGLRRNQDIRTYMDAISFVLKQGGKVVRLGDSSMAALEMQPGLIDLTSREDLKWTHSYVLANAAFHIGTTSGPTWIAPMYGVPTIQTNATSISRNAHTMSEHSIVLPKILRRKGVDLSLGEMLSHKQGFAEQEISINKDDLVYRNNSPEEIFNATRETYFRVIERKEIISEHTKLVNEIRKSHKAVGFGSFASTYLDANATWFLK